MMKVVLCHGSHFLLHQYMMYCLIACQVVVHPPYVPSVFAPHTLLFLQSMGIKSTEDRTVMKRELKALRPHAEKQKKLLEKQRKEEMKKNKKRHQFV